MRETWPTIPSTAAAELVARFRRQRPLRGGSLIVTIFGDSIMPRGGAIALGSLIRLGAPFGLNERLVRTATARLAQEGWLEARRVGKLSEYRLSKRRPRAIRRGHRAHLRRTGREWSGRWTLIVLPPMPRRRAARLRKELIWQGFGELCGDVFAHPEVDRAHASSSGDFGGTNCRPASLSSRPLSPTTAPRSGSSSWVGISRTSPNAIGASSSGFERATPLSRHAPSIPNGLHPAHPADPRVSPAASARSAACRARLLPADWPGIRAAELCREIYGRVFAASEIHLSATRGAARWPVACRRIVRHAALRRLVSLRPCAQASSTLTTTCSRKAFA